MQQDFGYALRALAKRPLYTAATVLVLALAIGANTTVFSVFNGFFLRPLPYPDDDRLVVIYNTYPKMGLENASSSIPDYLDRHAAPSLESIALHTGSLRTLGDDGAPLQLSVQRATPSLFDVLGVRPVLGRVFTASEAELGSEQVVVLSHRLWAGRFGGRAELLGQDIRLDGQPFRVLGVMPPGFGYPSKRVDAWVPFAFTPAQLTDAERGNEFSGSIGRLRSGATTAGLNAEFDTIVQRVAARIQDGASFLAATGFTGRAVSLRDLTVGELRPTLLVLQGAVLAVLLIACANVANLQLARIAARRKELSVRAALGAQRRHLVSLVLIESALLALAGGVTGLLLAFGGLELVRGLGFDRAHQGYAFAMDARVIGVTLAAMALAAVVSALLPMLMLLRTRPAEVINESGRLGGGGRAAQSFRGALVVAQVAMSVALLIGAGLLTKSFHLLQQEGTGFDYEQVLTARITLPPTRYDTPDLRAGFFRQALEEIRAMPAVVDAAFTTQLPFGGSNSSGTIAIDGYTPPSGTSSPHADSRTVSERYLQTLGIPVIAGRNFGPGETDRVALIDENLANRYWPAGDALGQRLRPFQDPADQWYTVIGVVPAIKHGSLTDTPVKETVYWYHPQRPFGAGQLAVRTTLPPENFARTLAETVLRLDPELPLYDVRPYATRIAESLGPQRAPMVLTLAFAAIAFALAVIGVYGVLTWAVTQRFGEIGVRMALGARSRDIVRLILDQGGRLTAIGLALGIAGALALGQFMSSQVHHVSTRDPAVFAVVIVGLGAAALLASWLPARRAGRISPMNALRQE